MRIEAFSEGKNLDDPDANEDQFLVLPGRGYAVIDGVTDITGRVFDGMRTGRLASRVVQRAAADFLSGCRRRQAAPEALVERGLGGAARRVRAARRSRRGARRSAPALRRDADDRGRPGIALPVHRDRRLRAAAQRLGSRRRRLGPRPRDGRAAPGGLPHGRGGGRRSRAQRRVSRACSFYGAAALHPDMQPVARRREPRGALLGEAWRAAAHGSRTRPWPTSSGCSTHGISGQTRFQNNTASPFSYAVLDGFDVPLSLVHVFDRPRESLRSIELYTDGYFKPAATPDVAAWEAAFAEVERIDPREDRRLSFGQGHGRPDANRRPDRRHRPPVDAVA